MGSWTLRILWMMRKGADERDPPGVDIQNVPEASGTQREDWFHMEPLHGARPKLNQAGRPQVVPEVPRVLEEEATGGIVGRDVEERGASAPPLPLPRQNMQEAEVVTHQGGRLMDTGASGFLDLLCLRGGHE